MIQPLTSNSRFFIQLPQGKCSAKYFKSSLQFIIDDIFPLPSLLYPGIYTLMLRRI